MKRSKRVMVEPVECTARGVYLGAEAGESYDGHVIAVELYSGESPTLTFMSRAGHMFCYLPPHAFGHLSCHTGLEDRADMNCPDGAADVCDMKITDPGWCVIGRAVPLRWSRYVTSIDWLDANALVHLVQLPDGSFAFPRVSRFQVGGERWDPPSWAKSRVTWVVK